MTQESQALAWARALMRCPSVTPEEGGALDLMEKLLGDMGFRCHRLVFEEKGTAPVDNLYARLGSAQPNFCFAGHTDVVPIGRREDWTVDPFAATVTDGWLIGRGAADMKAAIAAFAAATKAFLQDRGPDFGGSITFLITGDEEAEAVNGTRKVLDWMRQQGQVIDACLVGEPTSESRVGDMVKIGRRGSLNAHLVVHGVQGHTAYPQLADNPAHHLVKMLRDLTGEEMDQGSEHFPPSTLQITSIDIGNPASNVIPAKAEARLNVRFNDLFDSTAVEAWIKKRLNQTKARFELTIRVSGESFLTPPGHLSQLVFAAVEKVTGQKTQLGTTGGTSDARFIKNHCPVAELGLLNATAHKVDEKVRVEEIDTLTAIYRQILDDQFSS